MPNAAVRARSISLARIAGVAVAYALSAQAGLALAGGNQNITAAWPPTGIAVGAMLLFGRGLWPGVAIGALAANMMNGLPFTTASAIAVGNTLAPYVAVLLLRRLGFDNRMQRIKDVGLLLAVGAPIPMTISATLGVATLYATGHLAQHALTSGWVVWWIGDAMGVVLVTPLLLAFGAARFRDTAIAKRPAVAALVFVSIGMSTAFVLRSQLPIRYLILPFALWAAMQFEQQGAALVTIVLSSIAVLHSAESLKPSHLLDVQLLMIQGLNITLAFTLLSFAAVMKERRRAQAQLAEAAADLEIRVRDRTEDLAIANRKLEIEVLERRVTEEALRASEARFQEAQRLAEIGSFQYDALVDRNDWSDQLYRIYGLPAEGGPPGMADYLGFVREDMREHVSTSVSDAIATGASISHEYPIVLRDGTSKWVHAYVEVLKDAAGNLSGLRGTCQDITQRKIAEDALQASETRFRTLIESAPDAVIVADESGKVLLTNEQTTNLLGFPAEELIGRDVNTLLPEIASAGAPGAGRSLEVRRKDGSMVPVDVSLAPVTTDEGTLVTASLRDASERRRVEDALRSALEREHEAADHLRKLDLAKNAFLSAVSHELRTPLTAILGFAELLAEQDVRNSEEMTTNLVERLQASANRLADLLTDLLDIDRLHRGILEPRRRVAVLRDVVERALASIEIGDHEFTVVVDDVTVLIDPAQTERIVENLVANAVKYTPRDAEIHLEAHADGTGGVSIVVNDTGNGVPAELRQAIFEPFVRGDVGLFTQGTGIGLALVDRFARLHGGRAWVEDSGTGGAAFHVDLPGPPVVADHSAA